VAIDVEALYRQHGGMVLRRCRSLLRNEAEAVDAMHDTFVHLLRNRESLVPDAPVSLLYRTATFVCLNRLRTRRRKPTDSDSDRLMQIASLDDRAGGLFAESVLRVLFAQEPASSRVIATLHLHDGLTLAETAEAVGLSVSGVRKRLARLRAQLQAMEATP
jgi:RNA polymerase sigma-70 factor (ECF subfamily)